ncbi:hypothetical protein [Massilia aquatica]|nr:hypothetical protein [Massilia aquatica]
MNDIDDIELHDALLKTMETDDRTVASPSPPKKSACRSIPLSARDNALS